MKKIKLLWEEFTLLLRSVPSAFVALFVVSVVMMNLLANKTIVNLPYLALDGGFVVSWMAFLTMDVIVKHFGPRAANELNIFALFVNLLAALIFYLVAIIPTETDYSGFNDVFRGTWFILLSSSVAFVVSGWANIALNVLTGRLFRKNPDGKLAFFTRSFVSTFIGQFVDNFIFAVMTFMLFAPIFWGADSAWTIIQCLTAAVTGAVAELLMEVIFSPLGYRAAKRWKRLEVGKEYFAFMKDNGLLKEETCNE